jgi:hypothetical protein
MPIREIAKTWSAPSLRLRMLQGLNAGQPNLSPSRFWLLFLEIAVLALLAALLLFKGIVPGWRALNTDFPNYYLVARLLREGYSLDRIYDWIWLQRIKDHWGLDQSLVGFAGLTPFSALPIVPLALLPVMAAKRLWIITNLVFLGAAAELLHRTTTLGRLRTWLLCLLAIVPLRTSFLFGQMHIAVLLLLAAAYFFNRRGNRIACGVCLAIAGALKVYPLLFAGYFVWKRRWREAIAIVCCALTVVAIGAAWMGPQVVHTYLAQILPRSLQGEVLDPYNARAASGAALFHRLFIFEPQLNPAPARNAPLLYAVLYPLWQVVVLFPILAAIRASRDVDTEPLEWAAFTFVLLLLSPVPSSYHFVVLIFPIALLCDVVVRRRQNRMLVIAIALYVLICSIEFSPVADTVNFSIATVAAFGRLWAGMLLWLLFVVCLWRGRQILRSTASGLARLATLAVCCALLWTAGFLGYHRHFASMKTEMARRIQPPVRTLLSSKASGKPGDWVFTAMVANGYAVFDQNGHAIWPQNTEQPWVDQLSSAASNPLVLVEAADDKGSRIEEAPSAGTPPAPLPSFRGETPAVSADGSSIAYIHEDRGKGTLWIVPRGPTQARPPLPQQIVAGSYDVRDATFTPSGSLIISAKFRGRTRIFRAPSAPGNAPELLISEDDDVDSPAVSPDGQLMAYRSLIHRRWQLVVLDLASGRKQSLTHGDCNAYSPTWLDRNTVLYATDCGRGLGLTALASARIAR